MSGWMKKTFSAEGVTEWPPGPHLDDLTRRFGGTGAVILLIDVSGSMAGKRLREARHGARAFIKDAISGGYQVGLVLWSNSVEGVAAPNKSSDEAFGLLQSAEAEGGTDLRAALDVAGRMLLETNAGDQVMAIFSDGHLWQPEPTYEKAQRWKDEGIRILTLGLGGESADSLRALASAEEQDELHATTEKAMSADIAAMAKGMFMRRKR